MPKAAYFVGKVVLVVVTSVLEAAILMAIGVAFFGLSLPPDATHWLVFVWVLALGVSACAPQQPKASDASSTAAEPAVDATTRCEYPAQGKPAKPVDPPRGDQVPASGQVLFTLNTSQGAVSFTGDRPAGRSGSRSPTPY